MRNEVIPINGGCVWNAKGDRASTLLAASYSYRQSIMRTSRIANWPKWNAPNC
jgi:hypothetical protein